MSDHARDGPGQAAAHRVGRLRFELDGRDEATLLRLRGDVVGGAESWIPAALDAAFSALDLADRTLHIDRLEVDLGALPKSGFDSAHLTEALRRALSERLRAASTEETPPVEIRPAGDTLAAAFRHFLATGRLPWWSPADRVAALERTLAALNADALRELAREGAAMLATLNGAGRLVLQFSPLVAARIAAALPGARPGDFTAVDWPAPADKEAFAARVARIRRAARKSLPGSAASDDEAAQEASGETAPADPLPSEQAVPRDAATAAADVTVDADLDIAVADAGLVLLHPFLPALFEARGLAAAGSFRGEAQQQRAVPLTAALAAGTDSREEPDLVVAKLLCGWPLEAPLPREAGLDAADVDEAEALLRAAVGHWSALGKASPEALRETFLTRPGRLRAREDFWELEVERRGADVLLERLPWALNPVRLPWMPRPLRVLWG